MRVDVIIIELDDVFFFNRNPPIFDGKISKNPWVSAEDFPLNSGIAAKRGTLSATMRTATSTRPKPSFVRLERMGSFGRGGLLLGKTHGKTMETRWNKWEKQWKNDGKNT